MNDHRGTYDVIVDRVAVNERQNLHVLDVDLDVNLALLSLIVLGRLTPRMVHREQQKQQKRRIHPAANKVTLKMGKKKKKRGSYIPPFPRARKT